ncbi:MAG TPA: hypothetical protein PKD91_12200 [Bacteroidia bacterium]|nr:hypothetical protein [Bacteroidia bacterium]
MKSATIILTVLLLTLVGACKKGEYYQLTDDEMKWLVFKNYEVIKFKSGPLHMDYIVKLRSKAYERDGDTYSEFTSALFEQVNDTAAYFQEDSRGELYIFKGSNGFLVTFSWPHFPLKGVPLNNLIPNVVTIGGINYNDVFVIDATGLTDLRFYNKKIWYSKSRGILQIEDVAGTTWIRQF